MRRAFGVLIAVACLSGAAFAQSAAGTWKGETQGRGGTQAVTLTLAVDGSTLTGTFDQGGQAGPITEGMVDGNMISFQQVRDFGGNSVTLMYTGQIDGNMLTLTVAGGGRGGRAGGGGGGGGAGGGGGGGGRGGRGGGPIVLTRQ